MEPLLPITEGIPKHDFTAGTVLRGISNTILLGIARHIDDNLPADGSNTNNHVQVHKSEQGTHVQIWRSPLLEPDTSWCTEINIQRSPIDTKGWSVDLNATESVVTDSAPAARQVVRTYSSQPPSTEHATAPPVKTMSLSSVVWSLYRASRRISATP